MEQLILEGKFVGGKLFIKRNGQFDPQYCYGTSPHYDQCTNECDALNVYESEGKTYARMCIGAIVELVE